MVGQDLGELLGTSRRDLFDPHHRLAVGLGPPGPRDASVGHVTNEDVVEGQLALPPDHGPVAFPHQILPDQSLDRRASGAGSQAVQGSFPEHAPYHGGVLDRALLGGGQPVDARRDDPLHRVRQRRGKVPPELPVLSLADQVSVIHQHSKEFLREERIALRSLEDRGEPLGRDALAEDVSHQGRAVFLRERCEDDRGGAAQSSTPPLPPFPKVGAGHGHEQHGSGDPRRERLEEVQETGVRPVDVLE